jgi:hypothetical protein
VRVRETEGWREEEGGGKIDYLCCFFITSFPDDGGRDGLQNFGLLLS